MSANIYTLAVIDVPLTSLVCLHLNPHSRSLACVDLAFLPVQGSLLAIRVRLENILAQVLLQLTRMVLIGLCRSNDHIYRA
jgi:hypothetical protein